jgi:hypothetical protein
MQLGEGEQGVFVAGAGGLVEEGEGARQGSGIGVELGSIKELEGLLVHLVLGLLGLTCRWIEPMDTCAAEGGGRKLTVSWALLHTTAGSGQQWANTVGGPLAGLPLLSSLFLQLPLVLKNDTRQRRRALLGEVGI